jgi:aspartate/tyrosine/aromatic aminotransferase
MSLLAKRSLIKEDKSNIITLGAIAKEMKKKDPEVVNATIGMLYDEEGKLFVFDSVNKALNLLTDDEKYAYASTPGSPMYHEAVKRWIFQDYYDEITSSLYVGVTATPGGSGAISNTFANYLNPDEKALLPNYMWGNYKQFTYESFSSYDTYNLFNANGGFNLDDLKKKMYEHKQSQNRVVLVISDPCHNPTGYTMTSDEWDGVISLINEISSDNTPVVLLLDMAYIDYDYRGLKATRDNLLKLKNLNDDILTVLAFSGSKTLALYGVRIGAMVGLSKNKENIEDFNRANKFSSRAKWSNSTNLGANLISKIMLDQEMLESFKLELTKSRETLLKRATVFLEECQKVGLKTLPFKCGFFITIPCDNPDETYKKLVERKIHCIPMGNVIRVTISAISLDECKKLPKEIKECL